MTPIHVLYLASALGALLFFAAGLATMAMRRAPLPAFVATPAPAPAPVLAPPSIDAAELRALRDALDDTRAVAAAATRARDEHAQRVRELDTRVAEQARAHRDLVTEAERLRGRVADAEALRADYVRLRTATDDREFLRGEVARLQAEVRELRKVALAARPQPARAPARASHPPPMPGVAPTSIGESLVGALVRSAGPATRASAVADPLGFPLAATGDDGQALAAYAALLLEAATRASQFLPVARPASVEVIDERGARIAAYTFDVDADRLVLVDLAVGATDTSRISSTLAELATILTPS